MLSAFLPIILLVYGSVQVAGVWNFLPLTSLIIWIYLTYIFIFLFLEKLLQQALQKDILISSVHTISQWVLVVWILFLLLFFHPASLLPNLSKYLPQTIPVIFSIFVYITILWLTKEKFWSVFHDFFDPTQTPIEYFRARVTVIIFLMPPMLLWLLFEDLFLNQFIFSKIIDLNAYIAAPIFFVILYTISPFLFNIAWQTKPLNNFELESSILDFASKINTPISGVKIWDTFKEPIPNAAVTGLSSKLRYVYITTYLLQLFNFNEIISIIAHELGHIKLGHIQTYLIFSLDIILISLWIKLKLFLNYPRLIFEYEFYYNNLDLIFFIVLFLLCFTYLTRKSELEADLFAAITTNPEIFSNTMSVLKELIAPIPKWIPNFLITHPSFDERIDNIKLANKFTITELQSKSRFTRNILIVILLLILLISYNDFRKAFKINLIANYIKNNNIQFATTAIREFLKKNGNEFYLHPFILEMMAQLELKKHNYLNFVYLSFITYTGNYSHTLNKNTIENIISQKSHHSISPIIAFNFQFMQLLLKFSNLWRIWRISLFYKLFYEFEVPFG